MTATAIKQPIDDQELLNLARELGLALATHNRDRDDNRARRAKQKEGKR